MNKYDGSKDADTYVWQPKIVKAADVTVKYVDEQGNSIQSDKIIDATDKVSGDVYDASTTNYKFDALTGTNGINYVLDQNKIPENVKGKFTGSEQIVTYVYNVNPSTNMPTKPANPSTNTPTKPANPSTKTPTKPANPSTNTPTKPANPNTKTPTKPANPSTKTPTKPANPSTNTPTKPVNPSTNIPTLPVNPITNMPTLPANPGTNMPTLPVVDNNGNTNSNTTTNNVVNNVVDGAQTLLPKTNAEKMTLVGVISIVLASLAGLVVWKKRK